MRAGSSCFWLTIRYFQDISFLTGSWICHFNDTSVYNVPLWTGKGMGQSIKKGVKRMRNVFRYSKETSKRLYRMCLFLPLNFLLSFKFHPKAIVCLYSNNHHSDITSICLSIPKSGSLKKYKVKVLLSLILMVFAHKRRIIANKWVLGKGKFIFCRDESPGGFSHF